MAFPGNAQRTRLRLSNMGPFVVIALILGVLVAFVFVVISVSRKPVTSEDSKKYETKQYKSSQPGFIRRGTDSLVDNIKQMNKNLLEKPAPRHYGSASVVQQQYTSNTYRQPQENNYYGERPK